MTLGLSPSLLVTPDQSSSSAAFRTIVLRSNTNSSLCGDSSGQPLPKLQCRRSFLQWLCGVHLFARVDVHELVSQAPQAMTNCRWFTFGLNLLH